jgi:hypothetical protein
MEVDKNIVSGYLENVSSSSLYELILDNLIILMTNSDRMIKPMPKISLPNDHYIWYDISVINGTPRVIICTDDSYLLYDDEPISIVVNPSIAFEKTMGELISNAVDKMTTNGIKELSKYVVNKYVPVH